MEKWNKFYTKEQLKKLQEIEMDNLKEFIRVCEFLGLEWFVYGGTLLGVEKYQGLIPWDDDIDVALPRESYDRFVNEAVDVLGKDYFIQSPYNCKDSPFPYTKLRKRGTKYVEYVNRNINIETGVYIDIYPVDKIPDDEKLRKKQFGYVRRWILIYVFRQSRLYDKKAGNIADVIKNIIRWCVCSVCKIFPQKLCIKKIDYYMTMYNNIKTKRYAALNSPNYNNIYLNLYPLQKSMFENMEVSVPGDMKTHLKMRYGDYSRLPPEEERYGHIPYILDLGE